MKSLSRIFLMALVAIAFTLTSAASAQYTEKVLFNIQGGAYGTSPEAFVRDATGNIYGVFLAGGNSTCSTTCGLVYKLSPNGSGQMIETILHTFTGGADGSQPRNILMDANGNLFVSAWTGGTASCLDGCGAIVELSPIKSGGWKTTVLFDFGGSSSGGGGVHPILTLIDAQGNLYGHEDGDHYGHVFELSRSSSGTWTHKVIYRFLGGSDGGAGYPSFIDANGNIFGRALESASGACPGGCGLIFELSPGSSGTWTKTNTYTFAGTPDGGYPFALVPDGNGNMFGVTIEGGSGTNSICVQINGCGTLFELSPSSGGGYTETVLHDFNNVLDGYSPATLAGDNAGNLYVAPGGGGVAGGGVALEFTLGSDGIWEYTTLHSFGGGRGGNNPSLILLDSSNDVFGLAFGGSKYGVVFELSPTAGHAARRVTLPDSVSNE